MYTDDVWIFILDTRSAIRLKYLRLRTWFTAITMSNIKLIGWIEPRETQHKWDLLNKYTCTCTKKHMYRCYNRTLKNVLPTVLGLRQQNPRYFYIKLPSKLLHKIYICFYLRPPCYHKAKVPYHVHVVITWSLSISWVCCVYSTRNWDIWALFWVSKWRKACCCVMRS